MKQSSVLIKKSQRGMSIIGLMIGMLLSIMGIIAAMQMFHSMVDVAIDTKIDARHDSQLASAMLTAQMELQNAGRFLSDTAIADAVPDIFIGTKAAAGVNPAIEGVYWRYNNLDPSLADPAFNNNYVCNRFVYSGGQLRFDTVVNPSCKEGTDLFNILERRWNRNVLAQFSPGQEPQVVFSALETNANCWPYGQASGGASYSRVTVTIQSAASRSNPNIAAGSYEFCLPNMPS